ncbi:MAG: DNA helicase UvrD [Candidatus Buchananbacteria bacterium]|nr:DNA helicase UvrD [Candidatus Buchananbacteria bacterium]
MRYIADLHLHSKYSRACSKDLDLEHNDQWARIKGIDIVGTADFTHPLWFKELQTKLVEEKPGLFKLKGTDGQVLFLITTELSCIYSQGGKVRRIHLCVFAPDLKTVEQINKRLTDRNVNLRSDGRPIMGLSAEELTKIILDVNSSCMVVPAHAWTPWFSVFGSNSGFDSIQECFGSMTKYIYAIETGLSSDPPMNWRLSALDHLTLISNSDAHSPGNLGREANVFDIDPKKLSYKEIYRILEKKDTKNFLYTIEFFPQEGKYHWDGHRDCGIQFSPQETKKNKGICPKCKKKLTIGVDYRVDELADRPVGFKNNFIGYKSLVPLPEIISDVIGIGPKSKKVQTMYENLIKSGDNEFKILLDLSFDDLQSITEPEIATAIVNVREGKVEISPGYDGVYGKVNVAKDLKIAEKQSHLL